MRYRSVERVRAWMVAGVWMLAACSGDEAAAPGTSHTASTSTGGSAAATAQSPSSAMSLAGHASVAGSPAGSSSTQSGTAGAAGSAPTNTMSMTPSTPTMTTMPPSTSAMNAGASGAVAGAGGTAAATGMMPKPSADPEDGDPSKPVFTNPDMACRQTGGGGFGLNQANFKVDERDVIIDYPCNKHEGAPMTFILNLHGTTPVQQHFYQEGYFSAWQFVSSHNLIVATPSSVVQQWGNMDNGQDEPYLMDVIAYVYKAFAKFDIKQMWVGGHSWGAFYTSQFGCKAELADKVKGLIIMSGASTLPSCASKMSVLNTVAEMDIGPAINFQSLPMQHGCGAEMSAMLGNNVETFWPMCTPPFVHAKYEMLGKMHADFMDKEVVQSLVDWIKLSRQSQP